MIAGYPLFQNWLRAVFLLASGLSVSACQTGAGNLHSPLPNATSVTSAAIINKSPQEIVALFGSPVLKRSDPPAELWQFQQADCVVDIFFYSRTHQQPLRATHVIARSRAGIAADTDLCLSHLVKI
jgi:hypothetical protein